MSAPTAPGLSLSRVTLRATKPIVRLKKARYQTENDLGSAVANDGKTRIKFIVEGHSSVSRPQPPKRASWGRWYI